MKSEKQFDAVRTMREIRDEISREIQGMTFDQEREYIEKQLKPRVTSPSRRTTTTSARHSAG